MLARTSLSIWVATFCAVLGVQALAHASSREEKRACVEASTRGQTARDAGHLLAAREDFLICARDTCPNVVRKSCGAWLGELDQRTPSVLVRVSDADDDDVTDAQAAIDGAPAQLDGRPIPLDPGPHVVSASAPDGASAARKFLLAENEKSRVISVRLRPARTPPREPVAQAVAEPALVASEQPAPLPTAKRTFRPPLGALILGGVGLAALGTATGFGIAAVTQRRDLDQTCGPKGGNDGCSDLQTRAARRNARITDYALAIGAGTTAFAAAWTVYVWARKPAVERPAVSLLPLRDGAVASYARSF